MQRKKYHSEFEVKFYVTIIVEVLTEFWKNVLEMCNRACA